MNYFNCHIRIIEYRAGAGGYSASGDIGPDSAVQEQAQIYQSNDPAVRAQAEAWSRAQPGRANYGTNPWNSPPLGWSSVDPLWNAGALPQQPQSGPAYNVAPSVPSDPWSRTKTPPRQPIQKPLPPSRAITVPQSQVVYAADQDKQVDEGIQNRWDNTDSTWQRNQPPVSGSVDWNTWNPDQQSWTRQTGGGGSGRQWTSKVDHQVAKAQGQFRWLELYSSKY